MLDIDINELKKEEVEEVIEEEIEEEFNPDQELKDMVKKGFIKYEDEELDEEYKKYSTIKDGKRPISLMFRTEEILNKELNKITSETGGKLDLLDLIQNAEQNVNANLILIYYGSKLNAKRVTLQNFLKHFDEKTPAYKTKFVSANELYISQLAKLMGF